MERPLSIALISEHASPLAQLGSQDAGGQNVYVDAVSRQLGKLGHVVDIFTRADQPGIPVIVELAPRVRVISLSVGPAAFVPKDELWELMAEFLDAMLCFIRDDRARYDLIHSNFWMSGWVAMQLRHQLGLPMIQIFHALGKTKQRHQGIADTSAAVRIEIELDIVRVADRLIAQCPNERAELIEDYGAEARKIVVIPAAVDIERFQPVPHFTARRRLGFDMDDFVVVYVGRMLRRKGVRNLVRAFARLVERVGAQPYELSQEVGGGASSRGVPPAQRLKLLLVGGEVADPDSEITPEIEILRKLAKDLGIADQVYFAGKRQPDELRDFYGAGNVMVTTPWYEPFGLTPLEAMACARPVIGSAVGGLTLTIQDQVTGLLVPPRDPDALAAQLYQLLTQAELGVMMGQAARQRVEREFTWERVALQIVALYQSMVPQNN